MIKAVDEFLLKHGMHYKTIDLDEHTAKFIKQMEDGLAGRESSLLMIPAYISMTDRLHDTEEVIVIDAGGTNLRIGTVYNDGGELKVSKFYKYPMPGTKDVHDKDSFFNQLVDYLEPVIHCNDKIGFCFSFPTEILPNSDGKILRFNKEVKIDNAVGSILGESINEVLKARGIPEKRFVILNDTVATMLGGISVNKSESDSYVGYILGTGTNTCYLEKTENITKNPDIAAKTGYMAVNMESGGYDGFEQGDFDSEVDRESINPGNQKMEKMISGAYQGTVIFKTVRAAVAEGLFSNGFKEKFARLSDFTLAEIDAFCANHNGDNTLSALTENDNDIETLSDIIDASFERSARITTVNFSAILMHGGYGTDASRPLCITAEGSNFTKSVLFRPKLDVYIKDHIQGKLNRHCKIITVEDATLRGTATAALMI